ncbi:MAG: ABC transporter permease [Erysipelotrichaceae bacterium]|nr:ABC transporter permease [Erysipelotrichaceae bacterium]MBR3351074.1 ABC transporter permease [Erysipelotrichaceae bacterium]MBR6957870.1 ABC transporter permease [Erysipelotrichaceae bacterium]
MANRQPILRIRKNEERSFLSKLLIKVIFIGIALLISALFINLVTKLDPLKVYASMFRGAFSTTRRTWITIRDTALLLSIAVGLTPAFKMKFWNTGAEGQILVGGLVTAAMMIYLGDKLPSGVILLLSFVGSAIAGAIWGFIPAYFKARYNTNETLFTLMMNYVGIQIVEFFVDVWDKKQSHSVGVINATNQAGWFPAIFGQQYLLNIIIVAVLTIAVYVYIKYSKHGYEVTVTGESENTARYTGINVPNVIIRTMLLSGAICGLAGFTEVAGISHTISVKTSGGRGFTAIIAAWLAKLNPIVMIIYSFLIVFLNKGAVQIASDFNLNEYASNIISAILLFCILASEFFTNYEVIFRHKEEH